MRRRFRRRRRGGARRAFAGGLVRGSMHPTVTSSSPWNNMALTTSFSADKSAILCMTAMQVRGSLRSELGLKADAAVDIRIMRVDIWVPPPDAGSDRNFVVLSPCDWTARGGCDDSSQLNWYEGWGTAVQPAHVHYVWPRSISTLVIPNSKDLTILKFDCKEKCHYIVKFHMQWRPSSPDPRPTKDVGRVSTLREYRHGFSPDQDYYMVEQDTAVFPTA